MLTPLSYTCLRARACACVFLCFIICGYMCMCVCFCVCVCLCECVCVHDWHDFCFRSTNLLALTVVGARFPFLRACMCMLFVRFVLGMCVYVRARSCVSVFVCLCVCVQLKGMMQRVLVVLLVSVATAYTPPSVYVVPKRGNLRKEVSPAFKDRTTLGNLVVPVRIHVGWSG